MEKRALLGDIHPSAQLVATFGIALFITIILMITGYIAALPFVDKTLFQLLEGIDRNDGLYTYFMKYLQFISHLGMFIIPSLIAAWAFGLNIKKYLFLQYIPSARILFLSIILLFLSLPFINFLIEQNLQMHFPERLKGIENWMRNTEKAAEELTHTFLTVETISGLLFNLFLIAIIPAIGEEFMFRGVLMRIFQRWTGDSHAAVWITAIIFSAIHFQFFGFFPRLVLGIFFGYLVIYTKSLWPAMVAHFVNNAVAVLAFYFYKNKISETAIENIGKGSGGFWVALVSLVAVVVVLYIIRRLAAPHPPLPKSFWNNKLSGFDNHSFH